MGLVLGGILARPVGAVVVINEIETNDIPAAATSLDLSSGAVISAGAITPAADVDYFSFVAPAGMKVWVLVDTGGTNVAGAEQADPFLALYSADNLDEPLEADDDDGVGNGCGTTVTNTFASSIAGLTLPQGGVYYLRIETFAAAITSYRLYVSLTPDTPDNEVEPNDSTGAAQELISLTAPLGVVAGQLDSASDEDIYAIATTAGNALLFSLDCDPQRTGGIYLALDFLATDGNTVLFDTTLPFPRLPGTELSRAFCFTAPATGTYFIRVRHGISGNAPAAYQLMVRSQGSGTLLFAQAEYALREDAGSGRITVVRAGGSSGEVSVRVSTVNGTAVSPQDYAPLAQVLTFADGVTTQFVNLTIVDDGITESNETVVLNLSQATGGALIGAGGNAELVILDDDEVDDNGPVRATPLEFHFGFAIMAQTTNGLPLAISPGADQDWFTFTAPAGAVLWALVDTGGPSGPGGNSGDSQLTLFAADGTTVIEHDDDDGSGNGCDATLEPEGELASAIAGRPLTAGGTYYLRVRAFAPDQIIVPYTLFVVLSTAPFVLEQEVNNTPAAAMTLLAEGERQGLARGNINSPGDVDYYALSIPSNSLVYVSADGNPDKDSIGTDVVVDLLAAGNPEVIFQADSSVAASDAGEAFCFYFADAGNYLVRVSHSSPAATGNYTLMATRFVEEIPEIRILSLQPVDQDVRIHFSSQTGQFYQIERADTLSASPVWQPLDTMPGAGEETTYLDLGAATNGQVFYRVVGLP